MDLLPLFPFFVYTVTIIFNDLKRASNSSDVFFVNFGIKESLEALSSFHATDDFVINNLYRWRLAAVEFRDLIPPTFESTNKWFTSNYLNNPFKLLFLVKYDNIPIGHMGLNCLFNSTRLIEIDNVIRGTKGVHKGIMSRALKSMIQWSKLRFNPTLIYLRTTGCNSNAINFYKNNSFEFRSGGLKQILAEHQTTIRINNYIEMCNESDSKYIVLEYKKSCITALNSTHD